LFSNALAFTLPGKSVTVSFNRESPLADTHREDHLSISFIRINVEDEGVGIPEHELEMIFNKFIQSSQTKTGAGGTGLGLSICKKIVEAHQGKIWAENNPKGGATFSFLLPFEKIITSNRSIAKQTHR
jgi:signal transduction histidine kinase